MFCPLRDPGVRARARRRFGRPRRCRRPRFWRLATSGQSLVRAPRPSGLRAGRAKLRGGPEPAPATASAISDLSRRAARSREPFAAAPAAAQLVRELDARLRASEDVSDSSRASRDAVSAILARLEARPRSRRARTTTRNMPGDSRLLRTAMHSWPLLRESGGEERARGVGVDDRDAWRRHPPSQCCEERLEALGLRRRDGTTRGRVRFVRAATVFLGVGEEPLQGGPPRSDVLRAAA